MMTLSDVYLLKKSIIGLYDGDDYIVQYLLKKGYSTRSIVTRYYLFLSKDENRDVYLLKKSIIGLYDGDDYIVQYLLKKGYSTRSIVTRYYLFLSKDENRVMKELLKNVDLGSLIDFWQQ